MSTGLIRQPDIIIDCRQGQSYLVTGRLKDEERQPVDGGILEALTLTLRDRDSQDIINSREDQNCLQLNGVTVDANGVFNWLVTPDDNEIQHATKGVEVHIATFSITWGLGDKCARLVIQLNVEVLDA